jgi:NADPH:quinone reductase-like Zn-dependent oxidoreductase
MGIARGKDTMKAIVQEVYGSPDVLELKDIEKPPIKDNEVLLRVRAAAVNPPDWAGVTGVPYIVRAAFGLRKPRIGVRGSDVAGTVETVGRSVTRLHGGDEVFGAGVGTFAECAAAAADDLVPKPGNVTFEQAAAVPMAGLTALQALRDGGHLRPGQKVLVNGAGGGIGTFAVQIAKSFGAEVTGVCSTTKVDLVRSIGADHVIDYTQEDFTRGDEHYDVILDNVLNHSLSLLVSMLSPKGTLVPNGGQFHKRWIGSTGVMFIKAPLKSLFVPQRIRSVNEAPSQDDLLALKELLESGKVTPVIGRTFPLSQTPEAIGYFGEGHARGKVVISM